MTSEPIVKTISCGELHRLSLSQPVELIDVRTPEEFGDIRAEIARNVPLDALNPAVLIQSRTNSPGEPLYFICAVGVRSAWACEMMMSAGYENVGNVEGGTQAWIAAGLAIKRGG